MPLVQVSSAPPTDTGKGRRFELVVPYDFTAETHGHKFITRTAGARAAAERLGAQLVADYGTFQLYRTDSDNTSTFGNTAGIEMADEFNVVHLNVPINTTSRGARELADAGKAAQERLHPGGKRLHVVQFAGPARPEWFSALQKTGVRIINYLPHNAYLVYGDATSLERVSRLGEDARQTGDTTEGTKSFKQWDGPYLAAFKLDPSTAEVAPEGTQRYAVQLVADPDTNPATLQLAESFAGKPAVQKYQIADFLNFIVELPSSALMRLAAQEDVISIMPYTEPTLLDERQNQILINSLTAGIPNLSTPYATFLTAAGFPPLNATFTSNFVVDVTDQMVDAGNTVTGSITPPPGGPPNHTTGLPPTSHFALYRAGDILQPSRLAYAKWESTTSPTPGLNDVRGCGIGHGTLCAHIIAGNVPSSLPRALPHAESTSPNFYYGLGVAPFVRIGSSAIFNSSAAFVNPNFTDLLARSYQYGARISSNSWGAAVSGAYNASAQTYDYLVRDAQQPASVHPTPGNQEMVIVFAAGNSGPAPQTVGSPATAKNVITAGGSQNTRNAGENAENMYGSSSRGPCADGRRKPEVLAPATAVSGGVLQVGTPNPIGPGSPDPCVTSSPLPGTTGYYRASTGTSFACPAVAGGAALVRQYFLNNSGPPFNGTAPSPAMTKAYLMNSAQYMTGTGAGDTLWSNNQGMGRMALDRAFDSAPRVLRDQVPADKFTASGQVRTLAVAFPASGPLRITLAWTDVPGATTGSGPRLVNDLDLQVSVGGDTYRGNNFSGANSITGGAFDRLNNAESVFLPAGSYPAGTPVIIQVSAFNIAGDGVPADSDPLDQDYALVVYNAQTVTGPLVAFTGQTTAELSGSANSDSDGFFEPCEILQSAITVTNLGTSSATGVNVTITSPTTGVTIVNGSASLGSLAPGASATGNVTFKLLPTFVPGTTVTINVSITFGPGSGSSTASYTVATGCPLTPGSTFTFSNPAPITIPSSGTATPYPSTINVSGVPTGHVITKVTVTINNFNHTWPSDVGVALRGPGGQICVLFNAAIGGSGGVTGRTYTFDQAFPPLPTTGFPPSGTYGPNNNSTTRTFAAPMPAPPYNSNLNIFNGLSGASVNGTWELFVQDFVGGDAGNINGGWSITIQTGIPNCSTSAPCAVSQNCRISQTFLGQPTGPNTCFPTYSSSRVVSVVLTNTSALTISNIFVQVAALGYTVPSSLTPPRVLTADGATCTSGGQVGAIQSTVDGQAPIGSGTPIGTLLPGQSVTLTFRVATANPLLPVQLSLNVFGVGGTPCP